MGERGHNIEFVAQTDQGGRADGAQVMVHRGYAYIGHIFQGGFSVLDVRNPKAPKHVRYVPPAPDTWNLHLQTSDDLLLVVSEANLFFPEILQKQPPQYEAGLRIYDISQGDDPRPIGFMPVEGPGVHRLWYDGGDLAYLSCLLDGYSAHVLVVADVSDPTRPTEVGRFWLPGMWTAGGEEPTWGDRNVSLHHALVADGMAYAAWRDGGLVLVDVSEPSQPSLVSQTQWSPPYGGNTHNPLPLPGKGLAVALDEVRGDGQPDAEKYIWMLDVRAPENPVTVSRFPSPAGSWPGRFGPHNLWENRSGAFQSEELVFAAYCSAGVRVYDVSDAYRPEEVAYYVPDPPQQMVDPRPGKLPITETCDVFVAADGLLYATDYNGGLSILELKGI